MARPRRTATTPFGAWLDNWLNENPAWTVKAFGAAVAEAIGRPKPITDGAISQWLSGQTRRIDKENLRGVAVVTGVKPRYVIDMVYGSKSEGQDDLSPETLDAIEERMERAFDRALERAIRRLREEGLGGAA